MTAPARADYGSRLISDRNRIEPAFFFELLRTDGTTFEGTGEYRASMRSSQYRGRTSRPVLRGRIDCLSRLVE